MQRAGKVAPYQTGIAVDCDRVYSCSIGQIDLSLLSTRQLTVDPSLRLPISVLSSSYHMANLTDFVPRGETASVRKVYWYMGVVVPQSDIN